MRWLPRPQLVFESSALPFDYDIMDFSDGEFSLVDVPTERLVIEPDMSLTVSPIGRAEAHITEPALYLSLELLQIEDGPRSDPNVVIFHVVNLVGLYKRYPDASGFNRMADTTLEGGGWQVELRPSGLWDIGLMTSGGFGLTYEGILKRKDSSSFSTQEAEDILSGLYYFLSFVKGRWCWPCLYIGSSDSSFCWFRCNQPDNIDQVDYDWDEHLFTADEPVLRKCFVGFTKLWNRTEQRGPIRSVAFTTSRGDSRQVNFATAPQGKQLFFMNGDPGSVLVGVAQLVGDCSALTGIINVVVEAHTCEPLSGQCFVNNQELKVKEQADKNWQAKAKCGERTASCKNKMSCVENSNVSPASIYGEILPKPGKPTPDCGTKVECRATIQPGFTFTCGCKCNKK